MTLGHWESHEGSVHNVEATLGAHGVVSHSSNTSSPHTSHSKPRDSRKLMNWADGSCTNSLGLTWNSQKKQSRMLIPHIETMFIEEKTNTADVASPSRSGSIWMTCNQENSCWNKEKKEKETSSFAQKHGRPGKPGTQ